MQQLAFSNWFMKLRLNCRLIAFGLLFLAMNAQAKNDIWIITNLEPPFIVEGERGELTGYVADLVSAILKKADIDQKILDTRWERLEKEAESKSNVIVFALARSKERENKYHWITPLTANMFGIYAHQPSPVQVSGLAALDDYQNVVVLRGDMRETLLLKAGLKNVASFDYWPEAIRSFVTSKDSALFFSDPGLRFYCKKLAVDCQGVTRVFDYDVRQTYLAVSKNGTDSALIERLKKASREIKRSPEFERLGAQWLRTYAETTEFPMHIDNGVLNLWEQN